MMAVGQSGAIWSVHPLPVIKHENGVIRLSPHRCKLKNKIAGFSLVGGLCKPDLLLVEASFARDRSSDVASKARSDRRGALCSSPGFRQLDWLNPTINGFIILSLHLMKFDVQVGYS